MFFNLPDPDVALYRVFRLWQFDELVRDPEDDPIQVSLARHTAAAYAQCWSATGDSDTLLRAYSHVVIDAGSGRNLYPGSEGVLVKSTPRKLLFALRGSLPAGSPKTSAIVGKGVHVGG